MAEFEGVEIPEELLEDIAGGTMRRAWEKRLTKMAQYLRNKGQTKDECIGILHEKLGAMDDIGTPEEIAAIIDGVYR